MNHPDNSAIRRNMEAFVQHMLHTTVNLVRLDNNMNPTGLCSGVLIQKNDDVFVLSVYHGLKKGHYCLETNLVMEGCGQTVSLPLNGVFHTERVKVRPGTLEIDSQEEIDFGWCRLDLESARKKMADEPLLAGKKIELPLYLGPLTDRPNKEMLYGYAAWNRGVIINGYTQFLERSSSYELNLEFDGHDSTSGFYRFLLAREHQGDDYYQGASGAPIAEPTGKIVSLVVGGRQSENLLLGLPLAEYVQFVGL